MQSCVIEMRGDHVKMLELVLERVCREADMKSVYQTLQAAWRSPTKYFCTGLQEREVEIQRRSMFLPSQDVLSFYLGVDLVLLVCHVTRASVAVYATCLVDVEEGQTSPT